MSLYVRGKITPSLETLVMLVETLDASADDLLGLPPRIEVPAIEGLCRVIECDCKTTIEIEPKK